MMGHATFGTRTHRDALLARVDAATKHLARRPQPDAPFTVADLAKALSVSKQLAYSVIQRLVMLGRAEIILPRTRSKPGYWRLVSNAPRAVQEKPTTAVDQMWSAMRAMPSFSPTSLANHADVGPADVTADAARTYCRALFQAGYLRVEQRATAGHEAVYRLKRRSGPQAPKLRRIPAIIDPNTDETIVLKGGAL